MDMTDRYYRYAQDEEQTETAGATRGVAARNTELLAIDASAKFDLCRGSKTGHAKALASIPKVPLPASDPVFGPERAVGRDVANMTSAWVAFWNGSHSIYVNGRHKDVHYRLIAEAIAALVPGRDARVLDYGCGEALHADRVAAIASEVLLCEAAPHVRAGIAVRFAKNAKIRAVAPDEVERLPEHSLDLIVLHSVAQYLEPEDTAACSRSSTGC